MAEFSDTIKHAQWLRQPLVREVVEALGANKVKFVGGAVRDCLLGVEVRDIDVATSLRPEEVVERLKIAGIPVALTGLDHGTVMAHRASFQIEITSLRADLETDGRYAQVEYVDSWERDAERRDLTINAIYADHEGNLFDPMKGREDLAAGKIQFIGDARKRIEEDALRIMRYFRFQAWYGKAEVDHKEFDVVKAHVSMIDRLSIERLRDELLKLLMASEPLPAVLLMDQAGVLTHLFEARVDLVALSRSLQAEKISPDPLRRLAALLPCDLGDVEDFSDRFKLSGLQRKRLLSIAAARIELSNNRYGLRALQFLYGRANLRDAIIIDRARLMSSWKIITDVIFPLMGRDLIRLGMEPGKSMGALLDEAKQQWLDSDCRKSRDELLDFVSDQIRRYRYKNT